MIRFASFAEQGRVALEGGDIRRLGELMQANFDLREDLYTPQVLGAQTMRLIKIARDHGCPAKLPGSGGAVVGLKPDNQADWHALVEAYEAARFFVAEIAVDGQTT
jgi:mevalonate kinase